MAGVKREDIVPAPDRKTRGKMPNLTAHGTLPGLVKSALQLKRTEPRNSGLGSGETLGCLGRAPENSCRKATRLIALHPHIDSSVPARSRLLLTGHTEARTQSYASFQNNQSDRKRSTPGKYVSLIQQSQEEFRALPLVGCLNDG